MSLEELSNKVKEVEQRATAENWSALRLDLELRRALVAGRGFTALNDFMLANGRDYPMGPDSFAGERDQAQMCFMNATWRAVDDPGLTYVEGYVMIHGVALSHAFCVDKNGIVVDSTLLPNTDGRIIGYFGVPFKTDYIKKAAVTNKVYGVLGYEADKTLTKLLELGLEDGQRWLLERGNRKWNGK